MYIIYINSTCHVCGQYEIFEQIINVPTSVNNIGYRLPKNIDNDYYINVHIKREIS